MQQIFRKIHIDFEWLEHIILKWILHRMQLYCNAPKWFLFTVFCKFFGSKFHKFQFERKLKFRMHQIYKTSKNLLENLSVECILIKIKVYWVYEMYWFYG